RRLQAEPEQQPHLPEQLGAAGAPLVGCEPDRGTEAVVATGGVHLALGLPQRTVELRVEERLQLAPPAVVAAEQERHHGVVVEGTHECLRDAGAVRLAGRPHLGHRPKLVPVGLTAVSETAPIPVAELGRRAKAASRVLATCGTAAKDAALLAAADLLVARADEILEGNRADVERAEADGVTATVIDRLRLTGARIEAMAAGLRKVAALADPVGEVVGGWTRPNGLRIERVRVPLGVVAIIYENRPNVTSDAFGLCLKSGNAAFLRGSSGAIRSNIAIAAALREGVRKAGLPDDALVLVEDTSHATAVEFMRLRDAIDCLIPRGGPSLIRSILDNATVPYVIDG